MRILLTGAGGFTGRHFAAAAQAEGHAVVPLRADITDAGALRAELASQRPDAVVHLAAIAHPGHPDPTAFERVNVLGTVHLLSALCEIGPAPQAVLLASSAYVYGQPERSPIAESCPRAPSSPYGQSKAAMEDRAQAFADRLPVIVARPFNYTGPGQSEDFVVPKIVAHFRERRPLLRLGNTHTLREYNDVRMVCSAYLRLLKQPEAVGRVINVCSGQGRSLDEIIAVAGRLSGHECAVEQDQALVRRNEASDLRGDPTLLRSLCGDLPEWSLADTIGWMLDGSR